MGILTVCGLVALVVAVLTGSTPLAVIVVALAIAGIVLLIRDWREDRARVTPAAEPFPVVDVAPAPGSPHPNPDEFSPDISTNPDGPSSDARADQR